MYSLFKDLKLSLFQFTNIIVTSHDNSGTGGTAFHNKEKNQNETEINYTLRQKLSTTLYFYRYIFLHQYC
jgi:hypothetical protein